MALNARTIAAGGVAVGLLIGVWTALGAGGGSGTAQPAVVPSELAAPADGMRSAADVVAFWEARVAAAPSGFLDRTQLGIALAALARETADLDLYARAEGELREALEAKPDYDVAQLALGRALHSQHDFADARAIAADALAADPASNAALALLGDASLELGDYDAAERHYTELAGRERSAPAVSRLARLRHALGEPDRAVVLAAEALALSDELSLRASDRAFYRFQLGHFRFAAGDVGGSIDALEAALEHDPSHPGATERLAFVYAAAGRGADAEALYRELVAGGGAADLHGSYADVLRARGADAAAEEQEAIAVELAFDTIDAYPAERRHLAGFFTTRDPALAVELAEADLAERADVGAYDTLAWALFHDGRIERADEVIAAALAVGTREAELLYHAGAIALAAGDEDRAADHLRAALAINPMFHPSDAEAAAELLAEIG